MKTVHPQPVGTLQALTVCDLTQHNTLSLPEFHACCHQAMASGARLISLFGRNMPTGQQGGVVITAVLHTPGQPLQVLRSEAPSQSRIPSLTPSFPAAQVFERELWEQTGLQPDGHPWLKPVRYEGKRQAQMDTHPFFKVRGAQVHEVGVGPIHAGVIEPGHFRFMCHGESVQHLEIQLGYQHRGVEGLLLRKPVWQLTPLVESVAGDSVLAYATSHCAAMEALAGQSTSLATRYSRAIGLELERVAMHLATLNGMATDIAYLQPAGTYGRLRTAIINASQRVCGNRFGRGWVRPGTAKPMDSALRQDLLATLTAFLTDFKQVNALMRTSRSAQARMRGTGTVSRQAAVDLGLVGVIARASGVDCDLRQTLPGTVLDATPITRQIQTGGDCWARMDQRMQEAEIATQWLMDRLSDAAIDLTGPCDAQAKGTPPAAGPLQPQALCVALTEGTRGPVMVALETGANGQLVHAKLQDPSLMNWFGLAYALRGQAISDFPICNKSFDLSYCGNDL
jgi:Ni,Fe-hydrogenase III large subunit